MVRVLLLLVAVYLFFVAVIFVSGSVHGWQYGYDIGMTDENVMNVGKLKWWYDAGKPDWGPFFCGMPVIGSLIVGGHEYYWYFNLIAKIDKLLGKPYPGIPQLNDWVKYDGHRPHGVVPKNRRLLICCLCAIDCMKALVVFTFVGVWFGVAEYAFNKRGVPFLHSRRADDVVFIIGIILLAGLMVVTTI